MPGITKFFKMVFIGIDMHKDTHTAVIMDCWTNKIGEITFANRPSAYDKFMADVKNLYGDSLIKGIIIAKNQLNVQLTYVYPCYRQYFCDVDTKTAMYFWEKYPH